MMLTLGPMASHDQKSPGASHFDHLDLRYTVVPLMIPLVSCDADTECQWHNMTKKSDVAPHFNYLDLRNAVELFTIHCVM